MEIYVDTEKTGASEPLRRDPPVAFTGAAPVLCVSGHRADCKSSGCWMCSSACEWVRQNHTCVTP